MDYRAIRPGDFPQIAALFVSVFSQSEGEEEGALIGRLARELIACTDSRDLYGFVAADGEELVGAVLFSRLTFEVPVDAFILAPVAVRTEHQGMGIGQALIAYGLGQLKLQGVRFVATYGDPAFYCRAGFRPISPDAIRPPYELTQPEGWLGQYLTEEPVETVSGRFSCVEALDDPAYW